MQKSYIPKATINEYCEWLSLCSVRQDENWIVKVWVKNMDWILSESLLSEIINAETYNWKKIIRVYSSWHIFLNEDKTEVYLLTTQKDEKIQHQFTWWSPLEEENKNIIVIQDWVYKFDIEKVRKNARIRTKIRTWVEILEEYNKNPLVDWVFMENTDENGEVYYKLVCLMHFIVKKYTWNLWYTNNEYVIWWNWYKIKDLPNTKNIAPNAYIVSKKAIEYLIDYWFTK